MKSRVLAYLVERGGCATSLDIARDVLNMTSLGALAANAVIAPLMQDIAEQVEQQGDTWVLKTAVQPALDDRYVIAAVTPSRFTSYCDWASVRLVALQGHEQIQQLVCFEEQPVSALSLHQLQSEFENMAAFIGPGPLVLDGFGNQISGLRLAFMQVSGAALQAPILSMKRLAARIQPDVRSLDDLCRFCEVSALVDADPQQHLNLLVQLFMHLREKIADIGVDSLPYLLEYQNPNVYTVNFEHYQFDREFLQSLPELPGIYLMRDRQDQVIYVGKSKNLYNRVNSYFMDTTQLDAKQKNIREKVYRIEIELTDSEPEALLLEQENIVKYRPPLNTMLNIHERTRHPDYPAQLYFLPGVENNVQRVLCLRQDKSFMFYTVDNTDKNHQVITEIWQFFKSTEPVNMNKYPLIVTWLSNHRYLNCIQLENVVSLKELARLVSDYLSSLRNGPAPVIQI